MRRIAVISTKPDCFGLEGSWKENDPECRKCEIATKCIMASGTAVHERVCESMGLHKP